MDAPAFSCFEARGSSEELVVLLHAYSSNASTMKSVRDVIGRTRADADIWMPALPLSTFSLVDPNEVVAQVLRDIDRLWTERISRGQPYQRIILVGHSLGGLLARKVYVCAWGENADAPLEPLFNGNRRPWAEKVERIILLAGMNRGWSLTSHMKLRNAVFWRLGVIWGNLLMLFRRRRPLAFSVRRGAPFITQLRIQWLAMLREARRSRSNVAITIQLLGSIDDIVSPKDNIDMETGQDFVYLDVPKSGHKNVVQMDGTPEGEARAAVFVKALLLSKDELIHYASSARAGLACPPISADSAVTDVVFVIHGIRDLGYWTQKIAREVQREGAAAGRVIAAETSTYGYFPMLSFILPWTRRAKVQWFMDRYIANLARYDGGLQPVQFHFVGHSNGTYLLAQALKEYPACRFNRAVLAGSVVNTKYDWGSVLGRLAKGGQIQAVLNYVATADAVVAIFPKAVQTVGLPELGSAGHDGFKEPTDPSVHQIKFVKGCHSAALEEDNWSSIASFIVHGMPPAPPISIWRDKRSPLVVALGKVAPLVWLLILALVVLIGFEIFRSGWHEWVKTIALVVYAWLIWVILTRV